MPEEPKDHSELPQKNNFDPKPFGARIEPLSEPSDKIDETETNRQLSAEYAQPPQVNSPYAAEEPVMQAPAQVTPHVQQPVVEPAAAIPPAPTSAPSNPMTLVLQWLTYAFWGWTVLSLSFLTTLSIGHFMMSDGTEDFGSSLISYSLAAVIVLFIISAICDAIYSKREPQHKTGAAMVIMIIHAVIFALFAIGWVIAAVFAVVNLFVGADDGNEGALTTLITGLIISGVYGVTLLRTLRPRKPKRLSVYYTLFMAVIALVIATLGIVGPVMSARMTKDDRLIEQGLVEVASAVNSYANENNQLPTSLETVKADTNATAKELIERSLVEYTPGKKVTQTQATFNSRFAPEQDSSFDEATFSYELCVTYKAKKGTDFSRSDYGKGEQTEPDTYYHDAGRVCYDLVTNYIY